MSDDHPYLGTDLTPQAYYEREAARYDNPHAPGIHQLLEATLAGVAGTVLDLGCGDGLVSKWLAGRAGVRCVGVDRAAAMVARYEHETGWPGVVSTFDQPLPAADWIVSSYALHLATPAEEAAMWWRMWETGARHVVVVTPLKARPAAPAHYFSLAQAISAGVGPGGKTIHARRYTRSGPA
ncbi:MAG: class I SAM-dependent methyltransferase [Candidatus Sericytochromatia bacterium]|nr:class I SAM-dependent methyltransferase [Candidatus Sericytochromatia bacterium]